MVKATKEIQMENPREAETHSTGATCSPSEEQGEKPSMLCFKKRKKSCKKELTVKDECKGASEEKRQCIRADQTETKASNQSQSSKRAWAAIKNLARPQRKQKSSSRKKVLSDSQVQLEVDTEETCAQGFLKKRASSGVKMPCVRFSRGKKKPSPCEAVEESEGSGQANEVVDTVNKASEEPEDSAPVGKPESFSPVTVEEDQDRVKESVSSVQKSGPLTEPTPDAEVHRECIAEAEITSSETVNEKAQEKMQEASPPQTTVCVEGGEVAPKTPISKDQPVEGEEVAPETAVSKDQSAEGGEVAPKVPISKEQHVEGGEVAPEAPVSKNQHVEGGEFAPEAPISKDQPNSIPGSTELQEIPNICKKLPEGGESEKSINLPEESKAEETVMDFSQSVFKDDAASVQSCSSHQVMLEANVGTGVGIIITVTEAEDSDNTDSDQGYEPSPVLHRNKQKGNKKSSGSFDFGNKEGPEAGGNSQAEERGAGDQGHKTGEQYELLLIETASSLVKAAIQSSIEQLVNEMALEQNKHNSFL